ncbi:hypothetical protein MLD38_017106 [Melastoma candidum]|uniref:Uncharacterized protein n=1 Tax=Melastoma candidum TaxID=119954 RepID=A0ACB9QNY3_9MYRT|nr:hypothetical protein MLD38_017106 [Melastoma candidum]
MMRCCCCRRCSTLRDRLLPWLLDYDRLQYFAVILIYIQIGCALVGSLGAMYNGVQLINLSISLFALVAIESSSQNLGRTYAVLLFLAILLDFCWFILFARDIWNLSSETYGSFLNFSEKLTMAMQILGCTVRLSSSFIWVQIYRLGASYAITMVPQESDSDLRNRFINLAPPASVRQSSETEDAIGGSMYDPAYFTSLFGDNRENGIAFMDQKNGMVDDVSRNCTRNEESRYTVENCQPRPTNGESFEAIAVLESVANNSHNENATTQGHEIAK